MTSEIRSAIDFYERHPISAQIILAKLEAARGTLEGLQPEDLFAHDQDHYGGLAANDALAQAAQIGLGSEVVDLCAGLGGPARYFAHRYGANVTGITDELERDGLVIRSSSPTDRRSWIVSLTPKGRKLFETMAAEHEQWILELFSCLNASALDQVYQQIERFYHHVGGFGHLLIMGQAGFLEHDETVRGIKTFAREVYPRLKEAFPDTAISGMREDSASARVVA